MSIMEKIFGARANQAPATQPNASNNPAQNPPIQSQATPQTAPNGVIPKQEEAPSPLQKFEKVWEPTPVDPNAAKPGAPVDPQKIMEAAGKVDFTKVLSQEDLAKVQAGGADAIVALSNLLQKTAQTVYGQATYATTQIVEQAVAKAQEDFAAKVPGLVQSKSSKDLLLQSNKELTNPAVAPIVDMIQNQLVQKFPNASPTEIAEMAKEMMKGAAAVFNPAPAPDPAKAAPKGEDWSTYA